jgi:enediyne core biosynthesis thioesterase
MWSTPSYDYRHVVTLEETNLVGNVYFSNFLRWQGHCREHFLMERAPGVLRSLTDDLALVTVSCRCDYFGELYATDTVELRMTLGGIDDNQVSMTFDYYRINATPSELVARGSQTIACMKRASHGTTPVAVPDELSRALEPYREVAR